MDKFNIGDKVISKDSSYTREEVGIIVGIDTREDVCGGRYLVKFNLLNKSEGWEYKASCNNLNPIIEPYEGYAVWLDNLIKVKDECENKSKRWVRRRWIWKDIRMKFERIRKQKKEIIKGMSEKVLQLTSEIKKIECEMKKIIKEWHLD